MTHPTPDPLQWLEHEAELFRQESMDTLETVGALAMLEAAAHEIRAARERKVPSVEAVARAICRADTLGPSLASKSPISDADLEPYIERGWGWYVDQAQAAIAAGVGS